MYKQAVTVGVAMLLLLAPIAGVVGASTALTGQDSAQMNIQTASGESEPPSTQIYDTGHDNVSLWERSILPLRANLGEASTVIENQNLRINSPEEGEDGTYPANRNELGVFDKGEIPLTFSNVTGANTNEYYADEEVTVIVGHLESDINLAEMMALFDERDLEGLNENISFEEVANTQLEDGELTENYDADDSGQYVAMVATGNETEGVTVDNEEDLSVQSDTTIIGLEGFLVQSSSSEVTAPNEIEPGDTATFDASTDLEGDNITHRIALYDYGAFQQTQTVINVTAEPDSEFSTDDFIIEHDLVGLHGVVTISNETDDERFAGETRFEDLLEEMDISAADDIQTKEVGDIVFLDGSATVNQTNTPNAEFDIETFGNWSEGEYRWVHVATDSNDEFETSTDVMELAEDDDTGSPGIPSPGPPKEPDYRVSDATLSDAKIAPGDSFEVSAKLQNVGEGTGPFIAELLVDGEVVDDQIVRVGPGEKDTITFTHSFKEAGEYEIAINDAVAGTVTVGDKEDETEATFDVTDATLSDTEIEIGDSVDASATVTNTGDETGTFTAELLVDGEVVDEDDVRIFAGDETTMEFTKQFDDAGEYEIAINDADAGTLTVIEPSEDDDSAFPIPGFGPLAALLAIAISLFAIRFLPAQN